MFVRLLLQAPSFRFECYLMKSTSCHNDTKLSENLNAGYEALQAAALTAQLQLARSSAAGEQYQLAVLALASTQEGQSRPENAFLMH